LTSPANLAPIIIGIWMVVGVVLLLYFATNKPERITDTGKVFVDDTGPA